MGGQAGADGASGVDDERVIVRPCGPAGSGAQVRAMSARAFTPERQEAFFAALVTNANTRKSAVAAGVSVATIWRWRESDAAFRDRWQRCVAQAYADLEMELIGKARFGIERVSVESVDAKGRRTVRVRSDAPGLAVRLVQMHGQQVSAEMAAEVERGMRMSAAEIAADLDTDALIATLRLRLAGGTAADGGA